MAYSIGTNDDDLIQGTRSEDITFGLGGGDIITSYARATGNRATAEYRAMADDRTDLVFGGDGDDQIRSGSGADTVLGGAGDDTITAGAGADAISGGAGDDLFVFGWLGGPSGGSDTRTGRSGRDTIVDFQPGIDLIDLSAYENASAPGAVWLGTGGPTRTEQLQVGYSIEGNQTIVRFYAGDDGRGSAPRLTGEIELPGSYHLTESDFVF